MRSILFRFSQLSYQVWYVTHVQLPFGILWVEDKEGTSLSLLPPSFPLPFLSSSSLLTPSLPPCSIFYIPASLPYLSSLLALSIFPSFPLSLPSLPAPSIFPFLYPYISPYSLHLSITPLPVTIIPAPSSISLPKNGGSEGEKDGGSREIEREEWREGGKDGGSWKRGKDD